VVALSIAGALSIFLIYTAFVGQGIAAIKPSQLRADKGKVQLVGTVVGPVKTVACSGGGFDRASDPWVSFDSTGTGSGWSSTSSTRTTACSCRRRTTAG
jgi:hypothetical protein